MFKGDVADTGGTAGCFPFLFSLGRQCSQLKMSPALYYIIFIFYIGLSKLHVSH